ncbi:MAG: hypothetical protein SFY68_11405 [Candidatus Sumerlaeia bacterium]|nr:hypothetical protein [Candidatus Sumerlaeia bacterium]
MKSRKSTLLKILPLALVALPLLYSKGVQESHAQGIPASAPPPVANPLQGEPTDVQSNVIPAANQPPRASVLDSIPFPDAPVRIEAERINSTVSLNFPTPYSLSDCINIVERTTQALEQSSQIRSDLDPKKVDEVISQVVEYLRGRDDLHSTLLDYSWEPLDQIRIQQPQVRREWPNSMDRPKEVTAVSFEVLEADVVLSDLEIRDIDDKVIGPYSGEVVLRHSLPRRYVYHLYYPTEIKSIQFSVRKERPEQRQTPVIVMNAGRADRLEHGKYALFHLIRAQSEVQEGKIEKAAATLRIAQREIEKFRRQTRR